MSIGFYHIDRLFLKPAEHVAEDHVDQPLAGLFRCPGNMRSDDAVLSVEQDRSLFHGLFFDDVYRGAGQVTALHGGCQSRFATATGSLAGSPPRKAERK